MTAGCAASRRVLARTPVAPLPASSPKRPTGINGRTSAPPEMYLPEVCSFRLPLTILLVVVGVLPYLSALDALVWLDLLGVGRSPSDRSSVPDYWFLVVKEIQ